MYTSQTTLYFFQINNVNAIDSWDIYLTFLTHDKLDLLFFNRRGA